MKTPRAEDLDEIMAERAWTCAMRLGWLRSLWQCLRRGVRRRGSWEPGRADGANTGDGAELVEDG